MVQVAAGASPNALRAHFVNLRCQGGRAWQRLGASSAATPLASSAQLVQRPLSFRQRDALLGALGTGSLLRSSDCSGLNERPRGWLDMHRLIVEASCKASVRLRGPNTPPASNNAARGTCPH